MDQEVVLTRVDDIQSAVRDLTSQLKKTPDSYQAVIFLAAIKYDFAQLSMEMKKAFPNSEVIGASTAGEITPKGFTNANPLKHGMKVTAPLYDILHLFLGRLQRKSDQGTF